MSNVIRIDDVTLEARAGHPTSFYGKLSGKMLPGIDMDFHVMSSEQAEAITRVATQKVVQVVDPFVGQTYPASFQILGRRYTQGHPEHYFTSAIRSLDIAPEFKALEIEGEEFPVLAFQEQCITEQNQEGIYRVILLRLTEAQFVALQRLIKHSELSIRRMGVDEKSQIVRLGSLMYWSKHSEDNETFYKQIVRLLYPSNFPNNKVLGIALKTDQDILSRLVIALSARFERLADELVESGVISSEKRTLLLNDNWNELLDQQRNDEIIRQTYHVVDAEKELA